MNREEQLRWKEGARRRFEGFVREQIETCERIIGPETDRTRPERLEEIRRQIKEKAQLYWAIMAEPISDEQFTLTMQALDEIIDDVKRTAIH